MNIKTLTTYNVYNYGASLQAYALQTYLKKLGHNVEIINYQPPYLTRKYDYKWVNPESKMNRYAITRLIYRILKFLQRQTTLKRKKAFDYFTQKMLCETSQCYTSYVQLANNPPQADLYIVGSDQIWNVFYEAGRDPAFYLEFVKKGKRISYAASFSYVTIDQENKERIKKSLQKFNYISVREFHGINILNELNLKCTWVLDPIFLLDIDEWKKQMIDFKPTKKYLLIYDFEGNKELKNFAQLYAHKYNLAIYAIVDTYPLKYVNKNFKYAGPQEFLTLIYHCDAFISNSFHGTAFSILFHKPVFVFPRHRHKVNSRMESLLSMFNIKECLIRKEQDIPAALNFSFNFEKIDLIKEKFLAVSTNFIKKAIYE